MKIKNHISMFISIVLLVEIFIGYYPTFATPPSAFIDFQRIDDSEDYIGGIVGYNSRIELDRIRIALYDDNLHLIETGLLSDYSHNTTEKYYLGFYDVNINNKFDVADIIYIFNHGMVQPSWGVVLTYEPTGDIIASNTISGEAFSLEKENKEDYGLITTFLVIGFIIFGMIMIIVFYQRRKE